MKLTPQQQTAAINLAETYSAITHENWDTTDQATFTKHLTKIITQNKNQKHNTNTTLRQPLNDWYLAELGRILNQHAKEPTPC